MPYEGEFAKYRSIQRLVESKKVQTLLGEFETRVPDAIVAEAKAIQQPNIKPSAWQPELVIAVDGSHVEVTVENGYPGAEASYLTVASVIIDMAKMRQTDTDRPVDPKVFRTLEKADSIDYALPGCNVVHPGDSSAEVSLRRKCFELLDQHRAFDDGETLLDTYQALLTHRPNLDDAKCPNKHCLNNEKRYVRGSESYTCTCPRQYQLYSSDALRFHEGMNPVGTNGAMFAEVMQVAERLWVIHLIRGLEQKGLLPILCDMAFVMDGPLALFGHPAWLSHSMKAELRRLNRVAKAVTGKDILFVGVEKSGLFVQHFDMIDKTATGRDGAYPTQTVSLLTDRYIKDNIIFSDSGTEDQPTRPYGRQSYFSRKFFYKTKSGAKIVGTLPVFDDAHEDVSRADEDQYPRLADALSLLDQVVSSRYPNSISPLISAHAEAAIPLNLGAKVLEQMARQLINRGSA